MPDEYDDTKDLSTEETEDDLDEDEEEETEEESFDALLEKEFNEKDSYEEDEN